MPSLELRGGISPDALASAVAAGRTPTSAQLRALANTPVMASPSVVTLQTPSGALDGAQSTVTGTLVTPSWQPSTIYPAGAQLLHPTDVKTVIRRTTSGTSRATYDATEAALWTALPAGVQVNYPMRWNAGFLYRKHLNGFDAYGPRAPKRSGDAQENDTTINGTQWSVDFDLFDSAAGALEVPVYSTGQVRFIVDGQYVSATPHFLAGADDYNWRNIKLAYTAGYHRIRVEVGGVWCWIGGIRIASSARLLPPTLPASEKFAEVSDSYGEGVTGVASSGTAVQDLRGYPGHLARLLGFTDYVGLGISGSGFTTPNGSTYADRLADVIAAQPRYLLIQGSGNDNPNKATTLAAAALSFYQAVKAGCPNTKIVASGVPGWTTTQANSDIMTATLAAQAATAGIDFLDTTGWAGTTAALIADNNHPSYAGAEYLARRFAANLAAKWNLPI